MIKDLIPTCNIMGVNLAAIDMSWLIEFTKRYIKELSGNYMCVSNVHTTVMSFDDEEYCAWEKSVCARIRPMGEIFNMASCCPIKNCSPA